MKTQRKTKGYSPQMVVAQATRRKSSRLSSINNSNSEIEINQSFNLSVASGYTTSLPTTQQHTLSNRTQSSLSRSINLPKLNADNGSFGQSRQSSILSISRDASFYETESGRSESFNSTPPIISEISQSEIYSGFPSRSSSAYQSAFTSVNQSFAFNDDPNASTDSIKLDDDFGVQSEPSGLIEDTDRHEVRPNEENVGRTQSEDQNQEESRGFVLKYIPRIWSVVEEFWNTVIWWLSRLKLSYIEPLRNRVLSFNVIRLMCNSSRRYSPNELGIMFSVLVVALLAIILIGFMRTSPEVISLDVDNGGNELGHSDELIKAVVANQVKTLCAAEVQKRIPSANQEMTRYRSNAVSNENVVVIVRQEVQKAVEEMLYTYSQDKLNKADFALSSGGAKIISPLTSPTYELWPTQWYRVMLASVVGHGIVRGKPPITAIQPDTHVGQCWPFSGQKGQLAVLLSRQVYVTAVTYDHVSKKVAMGTTSAPKEIEVWGFIDGDLGMKDKGTDSFKEDFPESINEWENAVNEPGSNILDSSHSLTKGGELKLGSSPSHVFLGQFTYDINGSPIQTFEVNKINKPVRAVILRVNSNWDNPEYTCLYRFRVHGERFDAQN